MTAGKIVPTAEVHTFKKGDLFEFQHPKYPEHFQD